MKKGLEAIVVFSILDLYKEGQILNIGFGVSYVIGVESRYEIVKLCFWRGILLVYKFEGFGCCWRRSI